MKKMNFLLLLVFASIGCKTQKTIVIDASNNKELEAGKCYFSLLDNNEGDNIKKENSFTLELIEPKYKSVERTFSEEELKEYLSEGGKYRFTMRELHSKFVFKDGQLSDLTTIKNPIGFCYCLVEVPTEYRILTKQELSALNNTVTFKEIVSSSKIIKKEVKAKPKTLAENQLFFESGSWSDLKEAISRRHDGVSILAVKRKLVELGYDLTEDNVIDQATKDALLDFQKKNGLKEGQIDSATLERLGVGN